MIDMKKLEIRRSCIELEESKSLRLEKQHDTNKHGKQCKPSKHHRPSPRGIDRRCFLYFLCTLLTSWTIHTVTMAQTTKRADFEAIFPSLAQDILAHAKRYNLPANALEWFENVSPPFLIFTVLLDD